MQRRSQMYIYMCVCLGVRGGEPSTNANVHMLIVYTYRVIDPCIICDESQIDHPTEGCLIWIQRYWCAQAVGLWMFLLQPLQRGRLWWDSVWGCFAQAGIRAVDPSMWRFPFNRSGMPCFALWLSTAGKPGPASDWLAAAQKAMCIALAGIHWAWLQRVRLNHPSTSKADKPDIRHLLWDKPTLDIFLGGWNYWVASPNQRFRHVQQQNGVRQSAKSAQVIKHNSWTQSSTEQSRVFKTPVGWWLVLGNWDYYICIYICYIYIVLYICIYIYISYILLYIIEFSIYCVNIFSP